MDDLGRRIVGSWSQHAASFALEKGYGTPDRRLHSRSSRLSVAGSVILNGV